MLRILLVLGMAILAEAIQARDLRCFEFKASSPENIPLSSVPDQLGTDLWCYLDLRDGRTMVFAHDETVPLELTMLVDDSTGDLTIATGHLIGGKVRVVKTIDPGFSPLGVPLTVENAESASQKELDLDIPAQLLELLPLLEDAPVQSLPGLSYHDIEAGLTATEESWLPKEQMPFFNYWWPHSRIPLAIDSNSPLGKYDKIHQEHLGTESKAVAWEQATHSIENVSWGGHCNGWAASSVLYPAPGKFLQDPATGVVFSPSDVAGILAEASFCVRWAFYGNRYRSSSDDSEDIYPDLFHKVLRYYLGVVKKPIALDYLKLKAVDNNLLTGYRSTMTPIPDRPRWVQVKTDLRWHGYARRRVDEEVISMGSIVSRYEYELEIDPRSGEILAGNWLRGNPDFLWVPLAQRKCGRENPWIDHHFFERWLREIAEPAGRL